MLIRPRFADQFHQVPRIEFAAHEFAGEIFQQRRVARRIPGPGIVQRLDDACVTDPIQGVLQRTPARECGSRIDAHALQDVLPVVQGLGVDEPRDCRRLAALIGARRVPRCGDEGVFAAEPLDFVGRELVQRACGGEGADPTRVDLHDVGSAATGQCGEHLGVRVSRGEHRAFDFDVGVDRVECPRRGLELLVRVRATREVPEVDGRRGTGGRWGRAGACGSQDQTGRPEREPPHLCFLTRILAATCAGQAGAEFAGA